MPLMAACGVHPHGQQAVVGRHSRVLVRRLRLLKRFFVRLCLRISQTLRGKDVCQFFGWDALWMLTHFSWIIGHFGPKYT